MAFLFWYFILGSILMLLYFIIFLILLSKPNKITELIFGNPYIVLLGEVSFPWYLLHQNIGYALMYYLPYTNIISMILAILITFILSIILKNITKRIPSKLFN